MIIFIEPALFDSWDPLTNIHANLPEEHRLAMQYRETKVYSEGDRTQTDS